jgi:hypothetical protein
MRLASSMDLGHPRALVTEDPAALALHAWTPRGVAWPPARR